MATLGARNLLPIIRESAPGLYLDGGELGEILLPKRYIPKNLKPGDKLDVFVYLDSEDRLVATTESPLATVGEFACLRVVGLNDRAGAFLDWGLSKDLLLPFREQEQPVRMGQRVVALVLVDARSQRIVATTRLKRHLSRDLPAYRPNEPVNLLITGAAPMGYSAIVDDRYSGLLPRDNRPMPLLVGQRLKGFVRKVRTNGQIELSLDAAGYERVASLTDRIVQALEGHRGKLALDDDSPPEVIRQQFGVSKTAFKQALGKLYKIRRIRFLNPGIELLDNQSWTPGG
jgi:predicted RNA-binding protein (virulence factor B family)